MLAAMTWIDCGPEHLEAIRAIFNEAIAHTTALYENAPRTRGFMETWLENKRTGNWPVIGLIDDDGTLAGFGTYGTFRPLEGFRHTVEHSLYLSKPWQGRGLGREMLGKLVDHATGRGFHTMIAMIDGENGASVRLHEALGFRHCGRLGEAGFKFGRWLDVVIMELRLDGPGRG
jgi:L-amino acid N-acyltransferase YncA